MSEKISFTILGEAASKANSRKIVTIGGRPSSIKSEKARGFEASALQQIPPAARRQLTGPVRVFIRIWYASERPDLDESVVLDVLQDRYSSAKKDRAGNVTQPRRLIQRGVYVNDRQVREKHVWHAIDRKNPRVDIMVEPIEQAEPAKKKPRRAPQADLLEAA